MAALTAGVTTQVREMVPICDQRTAPAPSATQLKPAIAPTIAWEEETGQPRRVATCIHSPQARVTDTMPVSSTPGEPANSAGLTISVASVADTFWPCETAPVNSKMPANVRACRRVSAFDPTEVPMELATSFAPRFQAR